jgi:hypothetical protein
MRFRILARVASASGAPSTLCICLNHRVGDSRKIGHAAQSFGTVIEFESKVTSHQFQPSAGWLVTKLFRVTCVSWTRVGTLKLVEADEDYRQNRDFGPRCYGRGSAFDGMHAAIKGHDSAGEGLLPAHGSPMWRSHHAVFALVLQGGRFP